MKRSLSLLFSAIVALTPFLALAEYPTVAWSKRYNGALNQYDIASAVTVDHEGNVLVTGNSFGGTSAKPDIYTAKYSPLGTLLWEQRYNGPANYLDAPTDIAVDSHGNVLITGISDDATQNSDIYTAKYAATDGALLWEKRYSGPGNRPDESVALAIDSHDNVFITGSSYNTGSKLDAYTAKYAAADGALIWERRFNRPTSLYDLTEDIAIDANDDVVVTGTSYHNSYTAKYAGTNGSVIWETLDSGTTGIGADTSYLAIDAEGNVIVAGDSDGIYTAKYAGSTGAILWRKTYVNPSNRFATATDVAVDSSGNAVVTGYAYSLLGNVPYMDSYTAKYAATDGTLFWEKRYNGPGLKEDSTAALVIDSEGNVVVAGHSSNGTNNDLYMAKYAAESGALVWEYRRTGNPDPAEQATTLALDHEGSLIVAGSVNDIPSNHLFSDILVLKIAPNATFESRLSHLNLSAGTLSPAFNPDTLVYTTRVSNATESITVTPTTAATYGTAMINGITIAAGSTSTAIPLAIGSNLITCTGTAQDGLTMTTYTVEVIRETILESWLTQHGLASPTSHSDGDTLNNLQEFAFGTDPKATNPFSLVVNNGTLVSRGAPIPFAEQSASPKALFTRRKDWIAAGLTYSVLFSDDLVNWETSTATPTVVADDGEIQAVTVPYPASSGDSKSRFFRVKVTK